MMRWLVVGVVPAVLLTSCNNGHHTLTSSEQTACSTVLVTAEKGLQLAEGNLAKHNVSEIVVDFQATAEAIRRDLQGVPAGRVKTALSNWANDYDTAAENGPTSAASTALIKSGSDAAGALCDPS